MTCRTCRLQSCLKSRAYCGGSCASRTAAVCLADGSFNRGLERGQHRLSSRLMLRNQLVGGLAIRAGGGINRCFTCRHRGLHRALKGYHCLLFGRRCSTCCQLRVNRLAIFCPRRTVRLQGCIICLAVGLYFLRFSRNACLQLGYLRGDIRLVFLRSGWKIGTKVSSANTSRGTSHALRARRGRKGNWCQG